MRCFINPALTIHLKHQKRTAYLERKNNFFSSNLFHFDFPSASPLFHNLPDNCISLPVTLHPFSTNKFLLRKVKGHDEVWFYTRAFHQEESQQKRIYCTGQCFVKSGSKCTNDSLFALDVLFDGEEKIILYTDLGHRYDFLFKCETEYFLINWIF